MSRCLGSEKIRLEREPITTQFRRAQSMTAQLQQEFADAVRSGCTDVGCYDQRSGISSESPVSDLSIGLLLEPVAGDREKVIRVPYKPRSRDFAREPESP